MTKDDVGENLTDMFLEKKPLVSDRIRTHNLLTSHLDQLSTLPYSCFSLLLESWALSSSH